MIIFNNQFMERNDAVVDIEDRGYQFGDGVYEVIRVYSGQFFCFKEHMDRLERSAREINIELPCSITELKEKLTQLVQKNKLEDGYVYLQITRGVASRIHHFPDQPSSVLTAYTNVRGRALTEMREGIKVSLEEDIRWLRCDIKSLNLLPNILANEAAKQKGCAEAILHRGDTVTEASSSNVFIVKNNSLFTHPANHLILNGITRGKVIEIAQKLKIDVKETPFTITDLLQADEAFITNTGTEVGPINQVDDNLIGTGQPGIITRQLQTAFEDIIPKP